GLIAGALIAVAYGLLGVIARICSPRQIQASGRLAGMISGTLVACLLALERQVSMSFSQGMSTLDWRIVNTPVDLALVCSLGALAGAAVGSWVVQRVEPIPARQE